MTDGICVEHETVGPTPAARVQSLAKEFARFDTERVRENDDFSSAMSRSRLSLLNKDHSPRE
jgi:hypothetical protein